MSETISVRDHGRPCEHGSLWHHWFVQKEAKWWQEPDCLGGREMILHRLDGGVWMESEQESTGIDPVG